MESPQTGKKSIMCPDFDTANNAVPLIDISSAEDLVGKVLIYEDDIGTNAAVIFKTDKNDEGEDIIYFSCINRPITTGFDTTAFYSQYDLTCAKDTVLSISAGGTAAQPAQFFVNSALLNSRGLLSDINMGAVSAITSPDTLIPALKDPDIASKMIGTMGSDFVPYSLFMHKLMTSPAILLEIDGHDIFDVPMNDMARSLFEKHTQGNMGTLVTPSFYNPQQWNEETPLQQLDCKRQGLTAFYPN